MLTLQAHLYFRFRSSLYLLDVLPTGAYDQLHFVLGHLQLEVWLSLLIFLVVILILGNVDKIF